MTVIRSICVYCGSSSGRDDAYLAAANTLGAAIGSAGYRLVYGGGNKGIMGAVARSTLKAGGSVLGIIPEFLQSKEASGQTMDGSVETIVTRDMHERKHLLFSHADAIVTLPGGIGTLEEIVEVMTWAQLGRHEKPMVLANIKGFWNPYIALLDHMKAEGFLHTADKIRPIVVDCADEILPAVEASLAQNPDADGISEIIEKL
jgi:uncharacterized protein (TIGR00730 family)